MHDFRTLDMVQTLLLDEKDPSNRVLLPLRQIDFGGKVMAVLAIDARGICYYEIRAENDMMNAVFYVEFPKRLLDCSKARSLGA